MSSDEENILDALKKGAERATDDDTETLMLWAIDEIERLRRILQRRRIEVVHRYNTGGCGICD